MAEGGRKRTYPQSGHAPVLSHLAASSKGILLSGYAQSGTNKDLWAKLQVLAERLPHRRTATSR